MGTKSDADWAELVKATAATEPSCKDYLEDVAKFVRLHGGGVGESYPLIEFLGAFANSFGVTCFGARSSCRL